jgi:hypothetical protein
VSEPVRLAVWSGPRNVSTALMRSWENRGDCVVVDEPLYAHYLDVTGIDHPGRDLVVGAGDTDWRSVVASLTAPLPDGVRVHYQKHMTHHLVDEIDDRTWLLALVNVLLLREPEPVVASYTRSREQVEPADIGLLQQVSLLDELAALGAPAPLVIDSADLLDDPPIYLRAMCDHAGVPFTDRMLSWRPGPRDSDGVWAPFWYAAVERSTGFERRSRDAVHLDGAAAAVARACRPAYERLHALRWTP